MTHNPTGRPSDYTAEKAETICNLISEGQSLRSICRQEDMPDKTTVLRWLAKHEDFRTHYAQAREAQADHFADEILEIADHTVGDVSTDDKGTERVDHEAINRSRLRVDTRKWLMSKMAPKKYGDRVATELSGPDGGPIPVEVNEIEAGRRIAFVLAKAQRSKQPLKEPTDG